MCMYIAYKAISCYYYNYYGIALIQPIKGFW